VLHSCDGQSLWPASQWMDKQSGEDQIVARRGEGLVGQNIEVKSMKICGVLFAGQNGDVFAEMKSEAEAQMTF
jgi:hypothetical protein